MSQTKNFKHKSGVLMSVSSLPCKYGIGSFGKGVQRTPAMRSHDENRGKP